MKYALISTVKFKVHVHVSCGKVDQNSERLGKTQYTLETKAQKTSFFGEAAVKYQQSCPPKLLISWSLLSVAR